MAVNSALLEHGTVHLEENIWKGEGKEDYEMLLHISPSSGDE